MSRRDYTVVVRGQRTPGGPTRRGTIAMFSNSFDNVKRAIRAKWHRVDEILLVIDHGPRDAPTAPKLQHGSKEELERYIAETKGYSDGDPSKPRTWFEVRAKDKVLLKTKDKAKALRYAREKAKSLKRSTVVTFVTWRSARSHKAEFVESFAPNGSVSTVARVGRDVFGRPPNKTKPRRRSTTASTARKNRKRVRASFKTQMTALRAMSKKMTLAELRKLLRTSDFPEVHRIVRAELKRRGGGRASAKKSRRAPARRNKPSGERSYSFPSRWMPKMSLRSDGAIEMLGEHYSSIDDALRVHNRIHGIRMKYDPVRHSFYLESR